MRKTSRTIVQGKVNIAREWVYSITVNYYACLGLEAFCLLLYASIVRSCFAPKGVRFFDAEQAKKELLPGQCGPAEAIFR